jgi:hypothetical protein
MKGQVTEEEREKSIQEILSKHPSVTREQLDEMMEIGRPMEEGEEFGDFLLPEN